MKLVKVHWRDIVVGSGWTLTEEVLATNPSEIDSVGWLLYKDKEKLIIVHGSSPSDHNPYTVIPMGTVVSITEL